MADVTILERGELNTTIRTGNSDQRVVIPHLLPILPVRNIVVFPGTVMPLNVGRPKSKALLDDVMPGEKLIGVVTQRQASQEDPAEKDMFATGVVCSILKLFKLPDGNQSIIVHGLARFKVASFEQQTPFAVARIVVLQDTFEPTKEMDALVVSVRQQANRVIELSPSTPDEAQQVLNTVQHPSALADFLAANLQAEIDEKQRLLEELNVETRLRIIAGRLATQLDVLELQNKIQSQVKENIDRSQRKYFLQEQMKAIRKELGESDPSLAGEVEGLREKLQAAKLPEAVMKEASRELERLETIPMASPEYGVIRTYLQLMSELPWAVMTQDKLELGEARQTLDRDHHGLEKVKRRILEYLAVRKLKPDGGGAILCLVGPPGVGKTSLGKSIATAMNRKFIRVALGGVRDEADIRGHRRTYIGAMPGRIIAELRKAGARNPVMMLDEVDKLGADFRGDPASALLEVLDPAQNSTFTDHYLDVQFDLSKVLFVATANTMDTVPGPLRDRMEVIEIPGYTERDKLQIAQNYLVPRQLDGCGLQASHVTFAPAALTWLIEGYTREAGVRNLERNIGAVCRSIAADIVASAERQPARAKPAMPKVKVDKALVSRVLGPRKFEPELIGRTAVAGVATGLAYTPFGGEILFVEASRMAGKGGITLTGQIGEVMKESATAAFSLLRSRASTLGISASLLAESDVHIHVPAGAIPKDGPSAGVAMFLALASLFTNRRIRPDIAMTGEITLRGLVLPIGGLKEKALAARRAGIKHVLVPVRNEKDMEDVPAEVKSELKFHFVSNVDQAMALAMDTTPTKPGGSHEVRRTLNGTRKRRPLTAHRASSKSARSS